MMQQAVAGTVMPSQTLRDDNTKSLVLIPHHGRDQQGGLGVFLVARTGSSDKVDYPRTVQFAHGSTSTRKEEWHRLLEDYSNSTSIYNVITWAFDTDYSTRHFESVFGSVFEDIFESWVQPDDQRTVEFEQNALPEMKVIARSVGKARPIKKLELHAELFD